MSRSSYLSLLLFLGFFAAVAWNLAFANTPLQRFLKILANKPEIDAAIQERSLQHALNILTPVMLGVAIGDAFPDRFATFEQAYWTLVIILWIILWLWIQLLLFSYLVHIEDLNMLGIAIVYRPVYVIALIAFNLAWLTLDLRDGIIGLLGLVMFADLLWRILLALLIRASSRRA